MQQLIQNLLGKKLRVILDTNTLLLPGQGIDIFSAIEHTMYSPYTVYVVASTYAELKKIMNGEQTLDTSGKSKTKGSEKFNAKLGFILAQQKKVRQLKDKEESVDDSLVAYAADEHTYIFTLDRALKARIKAAGGKLLHLQGKSIVMDQN